MTGEAGSLETLCDVLDVQLEPVDINHPTGLLKAGHIELRGALHPVIPWNHGRLALVSASGVGTLLETSQAVRNYFGEEFDGVVWEGDECEENGGYSFEYRNEAGTLHDMGDIKHPGLVGAFCLPVIAYKLEGFPRCLGLLLRVVEGEQNTFVRIGNFRATGVEEVAYFPSEKVSTFRII